MLKKLIALIISLNTLYLPAHCVIQDDFANTTLSKNLAIKNASKPVIVDDFAQNSLDKNKQIKTHKNIIIEDKFAENNKNKNTHAKPKIEIYDTPVKLTKNTTEKRARKFSTSTGGKAIKIKIKKRLSTKHEIDEGDYIEFETVSDVKIKNKTYAKGTAVRARVETISQNKIWGVPADLAVSNFSINGISLAGEINKTGANRSLWLYPTVYITTFCFGLGLLLIPIRGGHAKITPEQIYTINYFE